MELSAHRTLRIQDRGLTSGARKAGCAVERTSERADDGRCAVRNNELRVLHGRPPRGPFSYRPETRVVVQEAETSPRRPLSSSSRLQGHPALVLQQCIRAALHYSPGETQQCIRAALHYSPGETQQCIRAALHYSPGETQQCISAALHYSPGETQQCISAALHYSPGETQQCIRAALHYSPGETQQCISAALHYSPGETQQCIRAALHYSPGETQQCIRAALHYSPGETQQCIRAALHYSPGETQQCIRAALHYSPGETQQCISAALHYSPGETQQCISAALHYSPVLAYDSVLPSLKMDPRPSYLLLLFTSVQYLRQCEAGPSIYIIDTVSLTVQPSQTVESGTTVTLRCAVSVSHSASLQLTHDFQFIRHDVPVHAVTTTAAEALYQLTPARAADSGTYECKVTVKEKSQMSIPKKLTVTGLQRPVLQLSNTQFFEREAFTATCSAPDEKGSLLFHFYQEPVPGEPQEIKQVSSSGNSSETQLTLRRAGDSNLYCDYDIPLLPQAGRSNSSNKVQVIVKGLFISPVMNVLPSTTVFEGDLIEVICKVVNPPSDLNVYLIKDRLVLKKSSVSLSHRYRMQEGDSGEFVCKSEWNSVQKETYSTVIVKELFSKPHLKIEPIEVFEGEDFTLTCSVSNYSRERINMQDMQFSIYKNNVQLTRTNKYNAVANASQNGNYTCKATVYTQDSFFVKESATVVVKAKVPVSEPVLSVVGGRLVVGRPFLLRCHSQSGSLPITYTLHGPNRQTVVRVLSRPGDQALFNTSAIHKSSDILNFLCQAKNNEFNPPLIITGQQLLRTTNIIEPVSRPVLSMFPNAGDVSEGQDLTLLCTVQKGTPPITFTWYHTDKQDPLAFQTPVGMKGSYSIKGVRGEHGGGYYCVGNNQADDLKRSFTVSVGVKMAGWKKGLIAVFCILFTVALIFLIIIKKGLLAFRRSRPSELSVKSASTKTERLSLTQAEVNQAANATPGVMGRSVWSEHVSGSESDDQNSTASPEAAETQYTEVHARQADPGRVPVKKGTDTLYSEVRNSRQGASEQADGQGSVEYAQLNHDNGQYNNHCNHGDNGDHSVIDDHIDDIDDIDDIDPADHAECNDDPTPGC
ncbi:platelet endothelial cell adhesion molecule [Polymixia lowei]